MKISNIQSNTNFGRIYQVIGDKKDVKELRDLIVKEQQNSGNKAAIYDTTSMFVKNAICPKEIEGKRFLHIVTGKDCEEEAKIFNPESFLYLIGCTNKVIHLNNNVKRNGYPIFQSIRDNV